jgi:hypothetical protein
LLREIQFLAQMSAAWFFRAGVSLNKEQSVFVAYVRNPTSLQVAPDDLPNRLSTGVLKKTDRY